MKKTIIRTTKVALIYFTLAFALIGFLQSCERSHLCQNAQMTNSPHYETLNTLEDMREWILWDIEEGKIDSTATWYLTNLDACIADLRGQTP